jgi:hypothetical protein
VRWVNRLIAIHGSAAILPEAAHGARRGRRREECHEVCARSQTTGRMSKRCESSAVSARRDVPSPLSSSLETWEWSWMWTRRRPLTLACTMR